MSRLATIAAPRASPTTRAAIGIARSVREPRESIGWRIDEAELLPVPYFHVVFTLPPPVAAIAFQNKAVVYAILFKSAVEAMTTLAANPRRLGAKIGGLAILHTWGQALTHHPHVHCVASGGGLSLDGSRWIEGRANFFLAVKPLSRLFRRLFLERLQAAFEAKDLGFFGDLAYLADPAAFAAYLAAVRPSTGSSTPRSRSADPRKFSPISAATPIASPSPTAHPSLRRRTGQVHLEDPMGRRIATGALAE